VVEVQVARAGYRLAAWLDMIVASLDAASSSPAAPPASAAGGEEDL
jgi:hypothetical protein